MSEFVSAEDHRLACFDCGESGARLFVTTKGENPGRKIRVCPKCLRRWDDFGLKSRAPEGVEYGSSWGPAYFPSKEPVSNG